MTESVIGKTELASELKSFGLMWFGQLVSLVGSGLTRFALGVWVYERTGSATQFTLITLFAFLPGLLAAPLAGALVDRWDRRWVMFWSDLGPALGTLAIVLLIYAGALEVWHIYLAVAWSSVFNSFQWPAYIAATTLLVPRRQLGRANGMIQFGHASAEVVAPILAGLLIATVGLDGVILIDFGTFLFAAGILLLVRIPRPKTSAVGRAAKGSLLSEATYGWTFIRERPGLLGLLLYFAIINLVISTATVLVPPLVLSFASPQVLASVLSIASAGLLTGSVAMAVTGGPRPRIHGVLAFGLLFGVALVLAGLRPSAPLVAVALFLLMSGAPIINGSSQAIWQSKVPPDVQGRVFAVRRLIAQFTAPLGFLCGGPLADYVFQPLLAPGGPLAGSVGRVLGVGPGRGIGLIYVTLAVLPILSSLWGYAQPHVRLVEAELPDAVRS
ncbi:MAG TPA: MFS transporter [Thermoanaerobaculia bacterium]|nr:MFS transporter [Thermoanaerobaculia bacterium]